MNRVKKLTASSKRKLGVVLSVGILLAATSCSSADVAQSADRATNPLSAGATTGSAGAADYLPALVVNGRTVEPLAYTWAEDRRFESPSPPIQWNNVSDEVGDSTMRIDYKDSPSSIIVQSFSSIDEQGVPLEEGLGGGLQNCEIGEYLAPDRLCVYKPDVTGMSLTLRNPEAMSLVLTAYWELEGGDSVEDRWMSWSIR